MTLDPASYSQSVAMHQSSQHTHQTYHEATVKGSGEETRLGAHDRAMQTEFSWSAKHSEIGVLTSPQKLVVTGHEMVVEFSGLVG